MSVLMEFSMFPTDKGESASQWVSKIINMIRESNVEYQLTPMGTIIETETIEEALAIVQKAYNVLALDCNRVYSSIKFDIRKKRKNAMKEKIKSIESKIGIVKK